MKTKEEPNARKEEVSAVCRNSAELTDDELEQVSGGDNLTDFLSVLDKSTRPGTDYTIIRENGTHPF